MQSRRTCKVGLAARDQRRPQGGRLQRGQCGTGAGMAVEEPDERAADKNRPRRGSDAGGEQPARVLGLLFKRVFVDIEGIDGVGPWWLPGCTRPLYRSCARTDRTIQPNAQGELAPLPRDAEGQASWRGPPIARSGQSLARNASKMARVRSLTWCSMPSASCSAVSGSRPRRTRKLTTTWWRWREVSAIALPEAVRKIER